MFLENTLNFNKQTGWIEVVCGSMFSGKTEELIRRIRRAQYASLNVIIFKPKLDTRDKKNTVMSPVAPPTASSKFEEILSPVVGTFFRSPNPDEAPFVEVGDEITSGQTVCIIEAMKVMNEIEAEVSGQIVKILIKNGEPVEYNQPLMLVNLN